MAFGAYIRQQREAQGIAMNDFARRLDISPAYWSRIEREMEKPPKDALIRKAVSADEARHPRTNDDDNHNDTESNGKT